MYLTILIGVRIGKFEQSMIKYIKPPSPKDDTNSDIQLNDTEEYEVVTYCGCLSFRNKKLISNLIYCDIFMNKFNNKQLQQIFTTQPIDLSN